MITICINTSIVLFTLLRYACSFVRVDKVRDNTFLKHLNLNSFNSFVYTLNPVTVLSTVWLQMLEVHILFHDILPITKILHLKVLVVLYENEIVQIIKLLSKSSLPLLNGNFPLLFHWQWMLCRWMFPLFHTHWKMFKHRYATPVK